MIIGIKNIFKLIVLVSFLSSALFSQSQDTSVAMRKDAPNLFFDCDFCSVDFYRQNMPFINFVRDRRMADIYLMVTINATGSKGSLYKLFLTGEKKFSGQQDTLQFEAPANMPSADIRDGILGVLKNGLLKFLVQTKLLEHITYSVDLPEENLSADKVKDKWNLWTFNVNTGAFASGN